MKQLFWKEWRELRLLPLGAALAVVLLMGGVKAYTQYDGAPFPTPDMMLPSLVGAWLLFGVLAGAGLFAQEIGTGTLQFMSSLPVPRRTIWWVKVTMAFGVLLLSLLTSAVAWTALCELWSPNGFSTMARNLPLPQLIQGFGIVLMFLLSCYSIALAVSLFFDRSLSAAVAAILACAAVHAAFSDLAGHLVPGFPGHSDRLLFTLLGLSILSFGALSYWMFTRGESLRGPRCLAITLKTIGICLSLGVLIVAGGLAFGVW